jgi:hypothetical protein
MKKLSYSKRNLWLGLHKNLGGFIFDETAQGGVDKKEYVRLYKLKEKKMGLFVLAVKEQIVKMNSTQELEYKPLVDFYLKLLKNIRRTHCFNCKADINSRDWSICAKCGWIRCQCSACGCSWGGHQY